MPSLQMPPLAAEGAPGGPPAAFGAEIPQPYGPGGDAGPPPGAQPFGAAVPGGAPQPAPGAEEDDGRPGGPTPNSSGFSWRLPGQQAAAPQSQGGIPNEFDHLFRGSGADSRHSLMPGQGGPAAVGQGAQPPAGQAPVGQAPVEQPQAGQAPAPQGQTAVFQQDAYPQDAYPQNPYPQDGYPQQPYQQDGYPQQPYPPQNAQAAPAPVPVDQAHTQAIPRVGVFGAQNNPDLLAGAGPTRSSSNRTLIVAGGVLVVLVAVAFYAFSGGGSSPKKTDTTKPAAAADSPSAPAGGGAADPAAKAQADAIYALIQQSQGLTSKANGAISAVGKCTDIPKAVQTFTEIATTRQQQADAVAQLPADKLPGGPALISHLQQAWQYSATSENELAAWAQDNAACQGKPGNSDNRKKADADGGRAGSAKTSAASEWNAAVAVTGEPKIKRTDL